MKHELIIIMDETELSVYQKTPKKNFSNIKINGEVAFPYGDIIGGTEFVSEYLLEFLKIGSFDNFIVSILFPGSLSIDRNNIAKLFNPSDTQYISTDVFKVHKNIAFSHSGAHTKKLEKQVADLSQKLENEKSRYLGIKKKLNDKTSQFMKQGESVKELRRKAKLYEKLQLEINRHSRSLIFLSDMKDSVSKDIIRLARNYSKEIKILHTSGTKVTKGQDIAHYLYANRKYATLRATSQGYIHWLTLAEETTVPIVEFKHKTKSKARVLAVVSSSSKEIKDALFLHVKRK